MSLPKTCWPGIAWGVVWKVELMANAATMRMPHDGYMDFVELQLI